jgi:micrococcal nuclease
MKKILIPIIIVAFVVLLYLNMEKTPKIVESNTLNNQLCGGTALCITDKVTFVVDGDTIYIKNYKIRLSLTNTPETDQEGFYEAKSFTSNLCPIDSIVMVDQDDKQPYDRYGRLLAKVTCSGKILNEELLESGHATILEQFCSESEFASESWAKKFGC